MSGCHRAQWFAVPIVEVDDESSRYDPHTEDPPHIVSFVPRDEVDLLDTWHTGGMRGTFSADVVVNDVFVPDRRIGHLVEGSSQVAALWAKEAERSQAMHRRLWEPYLKLLEADQRR